MRGNRPSRKAAPPKRRVYPRPCGETEHTVRELGFRKGLSPPMRGNHRIAVYGHVEIGSIPAHAGKPAAAAGRSSRSRVYRPCGETICWRPLRSSRMGLSPPMRGNPRDDPHVADVVGSIPAHAGKPLPGGPAPRHRRVYPRPCGETSASMVPRSVTSGLSPPMRGNRACFRNSGQRMGSIPAHAGKPAKCLCNYPLIRVYPRPCGETRYLHLDAMPAAGLSPPMRGNRHDVGSAPQPAGSIPAHAGKPDLDLP